MSVFAKVLCSNAPTGAITEPHNYKIGAIIKVHEDKSPVHGYVWTSGEHYCRDGVTIHQLMHPSEFELIGNKKERKTVEIGKKNLWVVEGMTKNNNNYSRTLLTREQARADKRTKTKMGYTDLKIVRFNRSIVVR